MMQVQDRMTRDPVTIGQDATVKAAADLMRARKIRHLPVVEGEGSLVGIVTDRDVRQILFIPRMRAAGLDLGTFAEQLTAEEIMSSPVVMTTPDADLADAAKIMHERKIGALPVVKRGRVVGILSEIDVLKAFCEMAGRTLGATPEDW
jgi:acetoin utilization protein AcuB